MRKDEHGRPLLTKSEAAQCEKNFQAAWAERERKREADGIASSPMDYYAHQAIWAGAYGGNQVQIIEDNDPRAVAAAA